MSLDDEVKCLTKHFVWEQQQFGFIWPRTGMHSFRCYDFITRYSPQIWYAYPKYGRPAFYHFWPFQWHNLLLGACAGGYIACRCRFFEFEKNMALDKHFLVDNQGLGIIGPWRSWPSAAWIDRYKLVKIFCRLSPHVVKGAVVHSISSMLYQCIFLSESQVIPMIATYFFLTFENPGLQYHYKTLLHVGLFSCAFEIWHLLYFRGNFSFFIHFYTGKIIMPAVWYLWPFRIVSYYYWQFKSFINN